MLKIHPADSNLLFDTEDGEIAAVSYQNNEITAVYWNNGTNIVDMTSFLVEYADYLFPQWEKELTNGQNNLT